MSNTPSVSSANSKLFRFFENFIYGGRWLIAPMYVGMLVVLGVYTYNFIHQIWELILHFQTMHEGEMIASVLGLVDILMIANLIIMIMVGGYHIFVRRFNIMAADERPQWLEHISSGTLKTKMGMSLIGVSSIHLLRDFVSDGPINWELVGKHAGIHLIFVISTIALAYTDKLMHSHTQTDNEHHNHSGS